MKFLTLSLYHPRVMKGGAQYVAKDLHDAAAADPEVEAIMLAGIDSRMFPQYSKVGASITALPDTDNEFLMPGRRFDDFFHRIYDPRRNKALKRFLETHRPDVIHVHHSLWVGLEAIDLIRATLPDVKIIYTLHEYLAICHKQGQLYRYHEGGICQDTRPDQCVGCFPERNTDEFILRRRGFRQAFAKVDQFISPSQYLKDRFVEWGLEADRITVIANGHHRRRPETWEPRHSPELNVFGFFGQFVDAKGIDVALRAARRVAETTGREIEIKVFGGNKEYATKDYLAKIEAVLDDAPEELTVTEVGSYSRDNVFELMSTVDWVVTPSIWPETFGLVVSEAWDARRPVLASRAGGLDGRIIDGVNGYSFLPGSDTGLAQLMEFCLGNADEWQRMAHEMPDEITVGQAWEAHKAVIAGI
ncbi:glycosyltransferase [Marinibacterium sp. SX1]|uniref:glycosyltransferase n=1 Tax=Marinibacterium sp. SX1 TaxID=3388424 RepID=UPI003D16351A